MYYRSHFPVTPSDWHFGLNNNWFKITLINVTDKTCTSYIDSLYANSRERTWPKTYYTQLYLQVLILEQHALCYGNDKTPE